MFRKNKAQLTLYNLAFIIILAIIAASFAAPLGSFVNLITNDANTSANTRTALQLLLPFIAIAIVALPIIYSRRGNAE